MESFNPVTHFPIEIFSEMAYHEKGVKLSEEIEKQIQAKLTWFRAKRAQGTSLKSQDTNNGTEHTLTWNTAGRVRKIKMLHTKGKKWVLRGSPKDKHIWLQVLCTKGDISHREFQELKDDFPAHLGKENSLKPVTLDF